MGFQANTPFVSDDACGGCNRGYYNGYATPAAPPRFLTAHMTGNGDHGGMKIEEAWTVLSGEHRSSAGGTTTVLFAKGSFGSVNVGKQAFNSEFQAATGIIRRECSSCGVDHRNIYYMRKTSLEGFDAYTTLLDTWSSARNTLRRDFDLYGSLTDLKLGHNAWQYCNYDDPGVAFPRDCGPHGGVGGQWNGAQPNVRFTVTTGQGGYTGSSQYRGNAPTKYVASAFAGLDAWNQPGWVFVRRGCHGQAVLTEPRGRGVGIASCTASSEFNSDFRCRNAYDGSMSSDWATSRQGSGSWIKLVFATKQRIVLMQYANRGGEHNKQLQLEFSTTDSPISKQYVTLQQSGDLTSFALTPVTAAWVKITVQSVYNRINNGAREIRFHTSGAGYKLRSKGNFQPLDTFVNNASCKTFGGMCKNGILAPVPQRIADNHCSMCDKGYFLRASTLSCAPCPQGTYTASQNTAGACTSKTYTCAEPVLVARGTACVPNPPPRRAGHHISTVAEGRFNAKYSDRDWGRETAALLPITNGYSAQLVGWTHVRAYAKGFLFNDGTEATATVKVADYTADPCWFPRLGGSLEQPQQCKERVCISYYHNNDVFNGDLSGLTRLATFPSRRVCTLCVVFLRCSARLEASGAD